MSIIRFSALKDVLYATGRRGALTMAPFRVRPKPPRGRIGQFGADGPEPGATGRLADHLDHYLAEGAPADGQPIAVMVHGFLFDPNNMKEFQEACCQFIEDEKLRKQCAAKALEDAQR